MCRFCRFCRFSPAPLEKVSATLGGVLKVLSASGCVPPASCGRIPGTRAGSVVSPGYINEESPIAGVAQLRQFLREVSVPLWTK